MKVVSAYSDETSKSGFRMKPMQSNLPESIAQHDCKLTMTLAAKLYEDD